MVFLIKYSNVLLSCISIFHFRYKEHLQFLEILKEHAESNIAYDSTESI